MTEYSPAKTEQCPRIFPNFPQYLKDNKHNSIHLARKYARIFVLGHYLFLKAHSFPRAWLEENCELCGTDNVQGQISEHIFASNGGYCLHDPVMFRRESYRCVCCLKIFFKHMNLLCFIISRKLELTREYRSKF